MRTAGQTLAAAARYELDGAVDARFSVRFSRARGVAALFDAPANSFRWIGRGTLEATRGGLRFFARRRGLLGLPSWDHRFIPSSRITSVYREANAIRLQFRHEGDGYVEFWAPSSATAASIVSRLASAQTVELDEPTGEARPSRVGAAGRRARLVSLFTTGIAIAAALVIAAGALILRRPITAPQSVPADASAVPAARRARPSSPTARDLRELRAQLRDFDARTRELKSLFRNDLRRLMDGEISAAQFDATLSRNLIPGWSAERSELRARGATAQADILRDPDAVAAAWQRALAIYAEGLREEDPTRLRQALFQVGEAQQLENIASERVWAVEADSAASRP